MPAVPPTSHPSTIPWRRFLLALALGTCGGIVFVQFNLPLAWMMGAMVATTVASLCGARLYVYQPLRNGMAAVLGVMLGSAFTPEVLAQAARWPVTLLALLPYLALTTAVIYVYFRRVLGLDPVTAYFSATPGGLNEMVLQAAAAGADERAVALIHGTRVLIVVMVIPFWFRAMTGITPNTTALGPSFAELALTDLVLLTVCGVAGVLGAKALRIPAYRIIGPMVVSAVVHATGISHVPPPVELVAVAQVVLGAAIGARFSGVALSKVLRTVAASAGSTAITLAITVGFSVLLSPWVGIGWPSVVLAYAPGGLSEMSLIALALGLETAFVASHHVFRIGLIVIIAPWLFRRRAAELS